MNGVPPLPEMAGGGFLFAPAFRPAGRMRAPPRAGGLRTGAPPGLRPGRAGPCRDGGQAPGSPIYRYLKKYLLSPPFRPGSGATPPRPLHPRTARRPLATPGRGRLASLPGARIPTAPARAAGAQPGAGPVDAPSATAPASLTYVHSPGGSVCICKLPPC